jgi:class 3 adenylate cyclase
VRHDRRLSPVCSRDGGTPHGRRRQTYRQWLINFGYPAAHEDDAEQAVRAGLELCRADENMERHSQPAWQFRIGIATGDVIIADSGIPGDILVGGAPDLSRRLHVLAEPGTVVVDRTTKLLTGGLFEFRDLGAINAPGLEW